MSPLQHLFQFLLNTYFLNKRCLFILTDPFTNIETRLEIATVYLKIYNNTLDPHLIFQHFGCQDILIYHENATDLFKKFEFLIRRNNERFTKRRYVISAKNANEVFYYSEADYVSDILAVVPRAQKYDLCTHMYNSTGKEIITLDFWYPNNSLHYGNDLFPNKLYNQNGRTLRIGTFNYDPFSIIENDNKTFRGIEASFLYEFVKKYNLTPHFVHLEDNEWGDIFNNWTGVGMLGNLLNDEFDIVYAALYTWAEYYPYLDYPKSFIRSGVTAIVPAPQLSKSWFTTFHAFSLNLWIAVLVMFSLDTLVLTLLFHKNHDRYIFQNAVFMMTRLFLLQAVPVKLNGKVLKYFMALNMTIFVLLSSSYSSGLSSVMTVPRYEKAIRTVSDLAQSGLPWGATTEAWLISLRPVNEPDYIILKENFVADDVQSLRTISKTYNFGFIVERLPYGHYAVGEYIKGDVITKYRIMHEDIYWEMCTYIVRKHSVLLPLLDDLILKIFEAGLAAYWEREAVFQYMDMPVQRAISYYRHNVKEHEAVKLKWTHVEGAFAMLLIGFALATGVFLLEKTTQLEPTIFIKN